LILKWCVYFHEFRSHSSPDFALFHFIFIQLTRKYSISFCGFLFLTSPDTIQWSYCGSIVTGEQQLDLSTVKWLKQHGVFAQGYSSHLRNKDRCFKVDCEMLLISHCLAPLQTLSYFISVCAINQNISNEICGCLLSTWLLLSLNSLSNSVSSMRLPVQIATRSNDLWIDHQMAPTDQLSTGAVILDWLMTLTLSGTCNLILCVHICNFMSTLLFSS